MGKRIFSRQIKTKTTLMALAIALTFTAAAKSGDGDAFFELFQRHTWEIGPEVYHLKYEEPDVMQDKGTLWSVVASYTYRGWAPVSAETPGGRMLRAEGRYSCGQVDYDGALSDGTPYTLDGIDLYTCEFRLLAGRDDLVKGTILRELYAGATTMHTLYAGIGYRYLNDDSSFDPHGYERESNYLYLPAGIETISDLKNDWSLGLTGEFDVLLWGLQKSHLGDAGVSVDDVENRQDLGYGLRGSIRFCKKGEKADFVIEPFVRYWWIDESEVSEGYFEPENDSTEYGIRLIWRF
jgi:hypothetical protein